MPLNDKRLSTNRNQTKPSCKDADTTIRKYSIEDAPA
jgi:hypothetical protein